jgi:hypothetical protein
VISEIAKLAGPENLGATLYVASFVLVWYRLGRVEREIAKKLDNGLTSKINRLALTVAGMESTVSGIKSVVRKDG